MVAYKINGSIFYSRFNVENSVLLCEHEGYEVAERCRDSDEGPLPV
jgi:hypothetical protein